MITLMVHRPEAPAGRATRFGGLPGVPEGFTWPACASCEGPMQFLGQLQPGEGEPLLLLFMCQNDPGLCDEWDAESGGNAVVAVEPAVPLRPAMPPGGRDDLLRPAHGSDAVAVEGDTYDDARAAWSAAASGRTPRQVLGQLGGEPAWLQGDETPDCGACGRAMAFVAQLEEGPDHRTSMNFGGGGCAYVYRCGCSAGQARLLWQS